MTESKSFNRTATVLLTVMVVFAMMPILSDCNCIIFGGVISDT